MLADVVQFLREDFRRWGCPASVDFGAEQLSVNDEPLRVVVVPTRDSFQPPQQIRGTPGTPWGSGVNPYPVLLRQCGFDAHLWAGGPVLEDASRQYAQDYSLLNSLVNQFCLSMASAVQGAWRQTGGEFVNGPVTLVKRGQGYVLRGTVEMPVVETEFRTAVDCSAFTWVLERSPRFSVTVEETAPEGSPVVQSVTLAVP